MTAPAAPRPVFGNYELWSLIGKGGMAQVYLGRVLAGPRAGQPVAIKRLQPHLAKDPDCIDLFTSEADLSRMLRHPNIVEVFEAGELNDVWFIAQEYVEGRDVGQVVAEAAKRGRPLPLDFVLNVVVKVLDALHHAHEAKGPTGRPLNVIHCDVSPSNVFLSKAGAVKLGDFGIAKIRALEPREDRELLWGKLSYLSPEQLAGLRYDRRADVWSVGALTYELLSGQKPFADKDPNVLKAAIREARLPPPIPRELPGGLESAVLHAFGKLPEDRYPTARAFADALRPYQRPGGDDDAVVAALLCELFP
jgi:serine/threonine-protein kinase